MCWCGKQGHWCTRYYFEQVPHIRNIYKQNSTPIFCYKKFNFLSPSPHCNQISWSTYFHYGLKLRNYLPVTILCTPGKEFFRIVNYRITDIYLLLILHVWKLVSEYSVVCACVIHFTFTQLAFVIIVVVDQILWLHWYILFY